MKQRKGCRKSCNVGKAALPHSLTLTSLHLRHSSFSNPSASLPTSQFILQPFRCFTYVIGTSPTSQLILQPFHRLTYITAHSQTLPPLHLRHNSFYNLSVTSPTSQLILQPFRRFIYVIGNSTTFPLLYLRHWHFTYFTWRAAHAYRDGKTVCGGLVVTASY